MFRASRTSLSTGICTRSSSGMGLRVALYASSAVWRKVGAWTSKVTHTASGFSSSRSRSSVVRKPNTAWV